MANQGAIGRQHTASTASSYNAAKKHYVAYVYPALRPTVFPSLRTNWAKMFQARLNLAVFDPLGTNGTDWYTEIWDDLASGGGGGQDDLNYYFGLHALTGIEASVYGTVYSSIDYDNVAMTWPGTSLPGESTTATYNPGGQFSVGIAGSKVLMTVRSGGTDTAPYHLWFVFAGWDGTGTYGYTPEQGTYFKELFSSLHPTHPTGVGVYHDQEGVTYAFYSKVYVDGAFTTHYVLNYRKFNTGTGKWGSATQLIGWSGGPSYPNHLVVRQSSLVSIRSGTGNIVYHFYLADEFTPTDALTVVNTWLGIVIMNVSTAAIISHKLIIPVVPAVTTRWFDSTQQPYRAQPQVFTKSDGSLLTQFAFGGLVIKVAWTSGTNQTPLIIYKALPDLASYAIDHAFIPGWETLEFKNDQMFHVIYMAWRDESTWAYGWNEHFWGFLDDVNSNRGKWRLSNELWGWRYPWNDGHDPVWWSYYGYQGKTYLQGVTANQSLDLHGSTWFENTLVDWWTEKDTTLHVPITITPTVTIGCFIVGPNAVNLNLGLSVSIGGRVDRPVTIGMQYDDLPVLTVVTGAVAIHPDFFLVINPDGVSGAPNAVNINLGLNLTIEGNTAHIATKDATISSLMWDQDWCADLMALINTDRASVSLAPLVLMTAAKLGALPDISQKHAEDMRDADTAAEDSTNFPVGWQNYINDRQARTGHGGAEISVIMRLNQEYNAIPDLDTSRTIVNGYTFPTAAQVWALYTTAFQTYFRAAFSSHTELYFMAGMAVGPSLNYYSADGNLVYFAFTIFDWQSISGGTGAVTVLPTPYTNELQMVVSYPVLGVQWHEDFLAIVNAQRARFGLNAYRLPTAFDFINHYDIAQRHSQNEVDTRTFEHDDPAFPVGFQTFVERMGVTQAVDGFGMENIQAGSRGTYDPSNALAYDPHFMITSDATFITPQEAFDEWWYSPGHRANLLRYTEDRDIVSYMGITFGGCPQHGGFAPWSGLPNEATAFYLTHDMLDLQETVMEVLLGVNYEFDGALIEELPITYDLTAYTRVEQVDAGVFSLHVSQDNNGKYGCRVSAQHIALLQYSLQAAHEGDYTGTQPLGAAHESDYRIRSTVDTVQMNAATFALRVNNTHKAYYEPMTSNFAAANKAGYSIVADVKAVNVVPYGLNNNVRVAEGSLWDIKTTQRVTQNSRSFWSLNTGVPAPMATDSYVTVAGRSVMIADAVVTQSESAPQWEARIRLTNIADYVLINEKDAVTLSLGGEDYELVITGKSLSRNAPPNVDAQITAKSAIVLQMAPFAPKKDYKYDTQQTASGLVYNILGALTWNMVDWTIPKDRVQITNSTPYDAANTIVQVAGGIIQCEKDGSIVVRSLYPVATNQFDFVQPDQTFTDDEDTISITEEYQFKEGYNKFRISEGVNTFGDSIEYTADPLLPTKGLMHVYPSPWRSTWTVFSVDYTTQLVSRGVVARQEVEVVEFASGSANTRYPIFSIVSTQWLSAPLGGLVYEVGSKAITADVGVNQGYGLAIITYTAQSYEYDVTGVLDTSTLVLMEDQGA